MSGTQKAAVEQISYQLGLLGIDRITELQKSLELVVLGEGDYLHDCAKLGEDLHTCRNQTHRLQPEQRMETGGTHTLPAAARPE